MHKTKNSSVRSTGRTSQEQAPSTSQAQAQLLPRSESSAVLSATSPITSPIDARKWIETRGYILAGEQYSRPKLADILFTLAVEAKIPADVKNAILAVAFLIEDTAEEDFASSLSSKIISKIDESLSSINNELDSAKKFLTATTSQQAEATISLQKAVDSFTSDVNKLTLASLKATETLDKHQQQLSEVDWPRLGASNAGSHTTRNPLNPNTFSLSPAEAKVQHRVILAAKQIYVAIDPNDEGGPTSRSIEDQRRLRDNLSNWLTEEVRIESPDFNNPRAICGVKILKNFDVLIETDTEASAELFKKHAPNILINLCPSAHIRPRNYVLIFKFVPCAGRFDPYDEGSLREIESDNGAPSNSISSASWCKRPDLRSPNQQTANLKVCFMSPEGANFFLKERIRVQGELVNVRMDLRIPTRCNQCQEYGHIRANCINQERCANCAGVDHSISDCRIGNKPKCVSCGESSDHSSVSLSCPVFKAKCEDINARFPENSLPYFPTSDRATWSSLPTNPPRPPSPLPQRVTSHHNAQPSPHHREQNASQPGRQVNPTPGIRRRSPSPMSRRTQYSSSQPVPSSSQHPVDNGWNRNLRQTELPRAWASQPQIPASSSSQQRPLHPNRSQNYE